MLQQYLPFTVLKPCNHITVPRDISQLQQYLPFTVLKLPISGSQIKFYHIVATVPTVYGIETSLTNNFAPAGNETVATVPTVYGIETLVDIILTSEIISCNSTYRLRY